MFRLNRPTILRSESASSETVPPEFTLMFPVKLPPNVSFTFKVVIEPTEMVYVTNDNSIKRCRKVPRQS